MSRITIALIRWYQRWAPGRVREACRFEPSCSNYMILSVRKFGTLGGITKGVDRILRCRPPLGGEDHP